MATTKTLPTLDFAAFYNTIDGKLTTTPQTRHGLNPSTLEPNPEVPLSTQEDVDRAVHAARKAFATWRNVPVEARRDAIVAFADAIAAHADGFAKMLTREQGRPFPFAQAEVATMSERLKLTAQLTLDDEVVAETVERRVVKRYTPLGVACGIVPWNFPVGLAGTKLGAALLTGNTFIMKPSPFTPYCGLKMCELAQQFFPPGVVQCLSGDDSLGPWLTEHPDIDKISFTGSVATGKRVMASCSRTLKRVTLELGGNDAAIVYPDVDVVETATTLARTCLFNSSQVCITAKRVYVHEDIYEAFRATFSAVAQALPVGDGFTDGVLVGPLTTEMQYKRVQELITELKDAKLAVVDQDSLDTATSNGDAGRGYFVKPVVVDNPPDKARVVVEEPFGPLVPLLRWSDEEELLARANDTKLGLGASVWTKDVAHGAEVAKRLEAGNVWVNTHMEIHPSAPFGGHKTSGLGVEGGVDGLKSFCNIQVAYLAKA